ncbi:putative transcriptional regulator [Sphingomonas zeicaulis]|uniref:MucR family transcriptional regulator n=1 Tax=Sphingomonas zeicaulis TaxID=1632740 RepID=UPI003D1FBDA8
MVDSDLTEMTADIVANYVANNEVPIADVGGLIAEVHAALAGLQAAPAPVEEVYEPATTIRKSLANPAKIISMIDGKPYATLTRHLSAHGLSPQAYRERYKLPADYPMTAPDYSARRKELALAAGLGRKPQRVEAPDPAPTPAAKPRRRKLGIAKAD